MRQMIAKFVNDQAGATSIEYAIIAGMLSIVILAAVNGVGSTLSSKFASVNSSLK
ncbi:putative Flp/Fap pilin component [Bradyrhizobium sp. STM 3843]|uniref:Flp family type IVb pilin n=1 Tax=unclassified Bradyrhizobium TaxID=2631580 RepID=UPI00024053E5|nr:Flp family type IVb pilin [Bradyrhizobium sp. STM 3843]CCE11852.1 putative Flp/Fap pilin component [Bradyrhizobium sp. STM 3843]